MEKNIKTFRKDLMKINGQSRDGLLLEFEEAEEIISKELADKFKARMDEESRTEKKEKVKKTKEALRQKKQDYRELISEIVFSKNLRVRRYESTINVFIEEMVSEFAGYSVLENAFQDHEVSDIYTIDWETIFVEKNGKNEVYPFIFRSPKHYRAVIQRFITDAGKQINIGESKIVDFELYQDRGCATSSAISPRDFSLTIRKHAEDHITRDQMVAQDVFSEKMAEFMGMTIQGECNIIYAGLTGSGKTTSLRAMLDYYVSLTGKRMIVCEDTQELFPKNKHTLELITFKSEDAAVAVPLSKLIITALRLKPKYIIVGEVRGVEAEAAVEAMETGHSTLFSMHSGTAWNAINRLITKYITSMPSLGVSVVERIIGSAVDYIYIQDNIPGVGRKVTSISEVDYDYDLNKIILKTICRYDFKTKSFVWFEGGKVGEAQADKMLRRGVSYEVLQEWL